MKKKARIIVISLIVIISIYFITYTEPIDMVEKNYGPVVESTASEVLGQKTLVQNENSIFGESMDIRPIYKVDVQNNKKKYISLTFDSSWNDSQTIPLLNILDEYDAKVTFFLTAFYVRRHPESVKEMLKRGHEIGNHSDKHVKFTEHNKDRIIKEIDNCHKTIKDTVGVDTCLFRFPYGDYNTTSIRLLKERGYYPIQWTHDSLDWKNQGAAEIIKRLGKEDSYQAGNIILFHNGADYTVEAVKTVLLIIKQKGLRCVRVSDLIYEKDFYVDMNGVQKEKIQ